MQDSNNKVFKFFSYRDPKCSETFTEFNNARQWSLSNITEAQLDEGILGVISSIDKPMSPYGEAVSDFMSELDHKKQKDRLLFRNRVKECTVSDLVRVSKKYLFSESKKSVIAGENFQDEIQKMGFKLKNI
jgi:Zn-dependent M16 (insulinase) family peptidase